MSKTKQSHNNFWQIIYLFFLGLLLGASILLFNAKGSYESILFIRNWYFTVWLMAIQIQTGVMLLLSFQSWGGLKDLFAKSEDKWYNHLWGAVVFLLLLLFLSFLMLFLGSAFEFYPHEFPLYMHRFKISLLFGLSFATIVLPGVIAFSKIYSDGNRLQTSPVNEDSLNRFIVLSRSLQKYLIMLGVMVSLLTISTGAFRQSMIAFGVTEENYPVIILLGYGVYFSLLLALLYIPGYLSLNKLGRSIRENYDADGDELNHKEEPEIDIKSKLESVIQLNESAQQRLKAGIAVLSPLISGLVSILMG